MSICNCDWVLLFIGLLGVHHLVGLCVFSCLRPSDNIGSWVYADMPEQQVQQCLVRLEVMNGVPAVVRLAHNESRDRRCMGLWATTDGVGTVSTQKRRLVGLKIYTRDEVGTATIYSQGSLSYNWWGGNGIHPEEKACGS